MSALDAIERSQILVVDDDADIRALVALRLRHSGYEVKTASNGIEALQSASEHASDLLLLDVSMPGLDGFAVCRELQARGFNAPPVIFLTAWGQSSDRVTGLDAGAVDYVVKRFEFEELLARVRAALRTKATKDALAAEAAVDSLTELLTRGQLETQALSLMALARRHGRPLGCLMIDLDSFKQINDTYGHLAGDTVLRDISSRIRATIRSSDVAGRYGGDEFVVLLPETEAAGAFTTAEKLREALAGATVSVRPLEELDRPDDGADEVEVEVRASVGLATFSTRMDTAEELFAGADAALYSAKRAGRDRIGSMSGEV